MKSRTALTMAALLLAAAVWLAGCPGKSMEGGSHMAPQRSSRY